MVGRGSYTWWARTDRSPETVDSILIGLCALIWLVLLGVSVAAVVALVDLGRGFHKPTQNPHTGLLYIVIGISVLIILAAVPLLLRARRATPAGPAARSTGFPAGRGGAPPLRSAQRAPHTRSDDRTTERRGVAAPVAGPNDDEVDRVLLRGTTELVSVIGTALIAVAAATYLMAVGKDGAAWVGYCVAGFVTAAMPVVPWRHLRQLRELLSAGSPPP
ncbi:MAG: DUF2561 family protein [Mycobacterium sp.]